MFVCASFIQYLKQTETQRAIYVIPAEIIIETLQQHCIYHSW